MPPSRPLYPIFAIVACAALSPLAVLCAARAQDASERLHDPAAPAYDVMSIKLNHSGSRSSEVSTDDGRFGASNVTLRSLLADAFDLKDDLIYGLAGPVESARFDVEAKVTTPDRDALKKLTREQSCAMLLPLLTERFRLRTHTEIKTLPVYELVLAKGGSKLKPSADQAGRNGDMNVNGTRTQASISGTSATMQALAKALSTRADRTVLDKTGLAGNFDFKLEWSKDDNPDAGADVLPGIFTAIQEQLGLKLQPGKGPVETLIVDHAAMPGEN